MFHKTEKEIMRNWKGDKTQPVVSICCITYNHREYIKQAIDGFLMQETDFPFEILIHDDASNDGTTDIIKDYEKKYPNLIRTVVQAENQYSKNVRFFFPRFLFPIAKGKYIALCEGDDYWTSPFKLKKQKDFMDENLNYSCCFHAIEHKDNMEKNEIFFLQPEIKGNTFYFEDILKNYLVYTVSLFFRKDLIPINLPSYEKKMYGDIFMQLMLTSHGPAYYLDEIMGVYRHHDEGVSKSLDLISSIENYSNILNEINNLTGRKFDSLITIRATSYTDFCYFIHFLKNGNIVKSSYHFIKALLTHPFELVNRLKDYIRLYKIRLNKKAKLNN